MVYCCFGLIFTHRQIWRNLCIWKVNDYPEDAGLVHLAKGWTILYWTSWPLRLIHTYTHINYVTHGVSLKTPRPRGWVRAGRPSGGESSFNKRNMYQYPHVSQLFILTSVAKPGIPGAIKNGWVCTADYRMLLGTAVRPVPARMPYISRLCDVGATDVKRWWWWWWWHTYMHPYIRSSIRPLIDVPQNVNVNWYTF